VRFPHGTWRELALCRRGFAVAVSDFGFAAPLRFLLTVTALPWEPLTLVAEKQVPMVGEGRKRLKDGKEKHEEHQIIKLRIIILLCSWSCCHSIGKRKREKGWKLNKSRKEEGKKKDL